MKGNREMTQKEKLFKALNKGDTVSLKTAVSRLKISEGSVGRIVHELRADGVKIVTGVNTTGSRTYAIAARKVAKR